MQNIFGPIFLSFIFNEAVNNLAVNNQAVNTHPTDQITLLPFVPLGWNNMFKNGIKYGRALA